MLHSSTELAQPVTWDLVALEHLLSKLLVAAVLNCIDFEPVRIGIHVMVLREEVADRVESSANESNHANDDFCVGDFASCNVHEVLRHIMCHLRCT